MWTQLPNLHKTIVDLRYLHLSLPMIFGIKNDEFQLKNLHNLTEMSLNHKK